MIKPERAADGLTIWFIRLLTTLCFSYIVAAQTLMDVPRWSIAAVGLAMLLAVCVSAGAFLGLCRLRLASWVWIPALFVCYCGIRSFSGVKHADPMDVISAVISAYLGAVGVAAALQAGVDFKAVALAQVVSSACHIVAGLCGIGVDPKPGDTVARYAGLAGNANEFGLQLTLGACLIWLMPRKSGALACGFSFIAAGYALATTGSRQALLGVILFVAVVMLQTWSGLKRRPGLLVASLAVIIICSGFLGFVLLESGREETAVQRALGYSSDHSYHKRMTLVEQGLRLWEQAPLFGNGLDSFRGLSGQGTYAHNNYVELLADGGVVAVILFYAIHLFILWHGWTLPKSLKICCVLFIVFLMALDFGCVGYKRKQTVMILMMFMSMVTLAKTDAVPLLRARKSGSPSPQVKPWMGLSWGKRRGGTCPIVSLK